MRKYQPIWEALKKEDPKTGVHSVALASPEQLHRRIINGVLKEKNKDLGFKYESSEAGRWYRIEYSNQGSKLTITMKSTRVTLGDI